jgi:hypothetical protein
MMTAHQGFAPADRRGQRRVVDDAVDHAAHRIAVSRTDLRRPASRNCASFRSSQLISSTPTANIDSKRGLMRSDQPGEQQLVDEEGRGMAEVEDQRMTQRDRLAQASTSNR